MAYRSYTAYWERSLPMSMPTTLAIDRPKKLPSDGPIIKSLTQKREVMYLRKALILESGPIKDLEIEPEFTPEGMPKPLIIVGRNGSGKSNFLSFLTDALIEIAAKKFSDVAKPNANGQIGHQWHRVIGGQTFRLGSDFEFGTLEFSHASRVLTYTSKGGLLPRSKIADRLDTFQPTSWPDDGPHKEISGAIDEVEKIYSSGCYVSFQTAYDEVPYWSRSSLDDDTVTFTDRFQNLLRKPITISTALNRLRPWLVDVIMDSLIDFGALMVQQAQGSVQMSPALMQALQNTVALSNVNILIGTILGDPQARIVRAGRGSGSRKVMVFSGNQVLLPALDAFSAGQARLLGIFGTILRYADVAELVRQMPEMEGIVVVDEVDAHLHSDLQYQVLPSLMRLFPKIQFIFTSHAPLFPLGMENAFGSDGYTLVELPSGAQIGAERFSEFLVSFEYLKKTKAFEDSVVKSAQESVTPRVLCEGQTDPKYLLTAAELLGFEGPIAGVEFDWIGKIENGKARDGGAGQLRQARKIFQNNPALLSNHVVLLFDCDQNDDELDEGRLHVRRILQNSGNSICKKGIENLLPENVFEDQFFDIEVANDGPNSITKRTLNKVRFCDYLCDQKRDAADFEGFRGILERIERSLFP